MKKTKVTIVVPTYNEEKNIDKIQKSLDSLKGDFEVFFSDGFSKDKTFEKIYYPKIRKTKYRSRQMNRGADLAKTDYIWFVHADSVLHEDSVLAIEDSGLEAGCFKVRFGKASLLMKMEEFFSNIRVPMRNLAFGDQGIFIKRELFEEIGGYKDMPIMEDYQLSLDLSKRGIKFGQLDLPIYTSPVRFEKNGIIKQVIKMQVLQKRFRDGEDIWKIYEDYNS